MTSVSKQTISFKNDESKWTQLLDSFEHHVKTERGLSNFTIRNYRNDLAPLFDFMQIQGFSSITDLTRTNLRDSLAWLVDIGDVSYSEQSGIVMADIPFTACPTTAGNDEFELQYK